MKYHIQAGIVTALIAALLFFPFYGPPEAVSAVSSIVIPVSAFFAVVALYFVVLREIKGAGK